MHTLNTHNFPDVTFDVTRKRFSARACASNSHQRGLCISSKQLFTYLPTELSTAKDDANLQKVVCEIWLRCMVKFLTANEVCEWLRVTRKALWELERAGELIPDRIGRRIRYREHEIIHYLDTKRNLTGHIKQVAFKIPQALQDSKPSTAAKITEINPVSERSAYTYIYGQPESVSVADIDKRFLEDLNALGIGYDLPNGTAV